eukprot:CAMPEP_0174821448 /NCGR_PEP_ID=MMETSP1107-20130205/8138_1 /TAXON_ID=36770 /ORGANISM="Paraphysomonas vestita, Strain GFlagA" /LENGTH=436 /DNA_ID=CAMNT_0016038469 /DNA_START=81 /DNA_END=1391 /DNA_ORIENTATION=-
MDDRKRGYDVSSELNDQKRPRQSDNGGGGTGGDVVSRICLSRSDFGKVIGKGGQTIANIRGKCGAIIKGTEVSDEKRLLVISGTFIQVVEAFDLVSEILYNNHMHSTPNEPFTFHVMIDHTKAGRVVGSKGSNIQALKSRSGATQVRVLKDPEDMNGTQLREILIEGSIHAVRRVHFHILELFYEINMMLIAASGANVIRGSTLYDMMTSQGSMTTPTFGAPPGFIPGSSNPLSARGTIIPMNSLASIGLHGDVVSRIREMQSYLNQFGLDLQVLDGRPHTTIPQMGFPPNEYTSASATNPYATPHHQQQQQQQQQHHSHHSSPLNNSSTGLAIGLSHSISSGSSGNDGHRKLEFYIPRETAGGIIGRGGQGLRDLMHETGCKIYIDKSETNDGARLVRILSNGTPDEESSLQFAKEVIIKRVNEIKDSHGEEIDG